MKTFNTTGVCIPEKHYMVDISDKIADIRKMVEEEKYFTINRARQYGKTTTLTALMKNLLDQYLVISLDFQGISSAGYKTEQSFVQEISRLLIMQVENGLPAPLNIKSCFEDFVNRSDNKAKMGELFDVFTKWCQTSEKEIVFIIDEVDSATNNQVFLDFLAQLREGYIRRNSQGIATFKSVILAGVTDVKHIKSKIRDDSMHKVNSPWNIAADFDVSMRLGENGISRMISEYASDHGITVDNTFLAKEIYSYTNGYPYLVSRICQIIDEKLVPSKFDSLAEAWTRNGIDEAVKIVINESNTLFESLTGKLTNYPNLKTVLKSILIEGVSIPFNNYQEELAQMQMYGFIENRNGVVAVANRIYETFLYNLFLSDEIMKNNIFVRESGLSKNIFVKDGKLDLRSILEHFIDSFTEICGPLKDKFKEKDGRELFLLYLKPIINGTGNYYIEAQTRNQTRTDVIIDYLGTRYIIEMKIWHGDSYNKRGEEQICEYLDYFGLSIGYMLSFNFNKKKTTGVKQVTIKDKVLFEAVV